MSTYSVVTPLKTTIALLISAIVVLSCKDKIQKTSAIADDKNVPTLSISDLVINYTENGIVRTKIEAPLAERYLLTEEPYNLFPKGFHLFTFTQDSVLESEIVADYALNKEKPEEMWMAVGNVVVINHLKNQLLQTDTLYWNRASKKIYTDSKVYIKLSNGTDTYAYGITADERFEEYEIRKAHDGHIVHDGEQAAADTINTQNPEGLSVP